MVNWKKFFLFVGLPLLVFYVFIIVIYYAFISIIFLLVLFLGICCLRFSKRKIWPGLSKLSLAMLLFFTLMVSNPLYWPTQIVRHIDVSRVIQPTDNLVQGLNSTDPGYMWDYLNQTSNGTITPAYFYTMSPDNQLGNMTNYILDWVIVYHYIPEVYGVIDYVSSAHEAITHGKGDCHSRTIVMVSFFIFMGYDAWACETPFHWYTCVFFGPGQTDPHYYYRDVFRDGLPWTDPQIMFNDETVVFTMNIFERMGDTLFGLPFYDKIMELFTTGVVQILLAPILIGIGFLMTLGIESTDWKSRKSYLKNAILCSVLLITGFLIAFGFSVFVPQITLLVMLMTVAVAAQSVHSKLGARLSFNPKETT